MSIGNKVYRIKSRLRFITFVMILFVSIISMTNLAFGYGDVSSLTVEKFENVMISPGDTLWSIASQYTGSGHDVRELIYTICQINEVSPDSIYPGQMLRIPLGY